MKRAETNNSRGNEITHRERAIKAYISFFLSFFFGMCLSSSSSYVYVHNVTTQVYTYRVVICIGATRQG